MKASELRTGNWYNEFGMPKQADALLIVKLSQIEHAGKIAIDVSPIPLTEEWLLKFGFEKPAHSWCGKIFHLSAWDNFPLNWCVAMNKNNAVVVLKLKYVHSLQNLYFALCGEELTVK